MTAQSPLEMSGASASRMLGRKMDSIPFSSYQALIIFILALVGFIEGYDLFMTGSLIVLAKGRSTSPRPMCNGCSLALPCWGRLAALAFRRSATS